MPTSSILSTLRGLDKVTYRMHPLLRLTHYQTLQVRVCSIKYIGNIRGISHDNDDQIQLVSSKG